MKTGIKIEFIILKSTHIFIHTYLNIWYSAMFKFTNWVVKRKKSRMRLACSWKIMTTITDNYNKTGRKVILHYYKTVHINRVHIGGLEVRKNSCRRNIIWQKLFQTNKTIVGRGDDQIRAQTFVGCWYTPSFSQHYDHIHLTPIL